MPLYLAIDAGGTKTRCLLADEDRVLARASAGTVKLMRVEEEEATARLRAMLAEVAAGAAVSLGDVTRTCFGLAGSRSESVRAWAAKSIADCGVSGALVISGDEEIALDAAFAGGPGILVIAGTGSNVIGRARDGRLFGAGGWGPVLGDEGSGYWIGLEAIRAALRVHDEGDSDGAAAALLREAGGAWGLASLGELIALGNLRAPSAAASAPDFAALAPVVTRLAAEGNRIAAGVLQRAGDSLAAFVALVHRKMLAAAAVQGPDSPAVAFTGSVLGHMESVREAMIDRLAEVGCRVSVVPDSIDPLDGALYRARLESHAGR